MNYKYFINEEKDTIVIKADDAFFEMRRELIGLINKYNLCSFEIFEILEKYRERINKIRGVARCANEDEFNAEFGKNLAKTKFLKKYEMYRVRIYSDIEELLLNKAFAIQNRLNKAINRYHNHADIVVEAKIKR